MPFLWEAVINTLKPPVVLVVDDEPCICDIVSFLLEEGGYDVRIAGSVLDAMKILRSEHVDAIISDINMPQLSGFDFATKVKKWPTRKPIMFFMTTKCDLTPRDLLNYGVIDTFFKPFNIDIILDNLGRLLLKKEYSVLRTSIRRDCKIQLEISDISATKKVVLTAYNISHGGMFIATDDTSFEIFSEILIKFLEGDELVNKSLSTPYNWITILRESDILFNHQFLKS